MKNIGDRIRSARKALGITQGQLAKLCSSQDSKVTTAAVSNWENGLNQPSSGKYNALARALDVSAEWLITGNDTRPGLSDHEQAPFQTPDALLPIVGSVQAGVFKPALQYEGDWERVPFMTPAGYNSADFYILRVVGDSMDKHYPDGSMIVCCKFSAYKGSLSEGRHIIVERRDLYSEGAEATVKELVHDTDHQQWLLMPKSSNSEWKPIPIPNGNGEELDFAGRDDLSITGVVYAKYEVNDNF